MMTLLPTDISRPSEGLVPCLISGAERVLIATVPTLAFDALLKGEWDAPDSSCSMTTPLPQSNGDGEQPGTALYSETADMSHRLASRLHGSRCCLPTTPTTYAVRLQGNGSYVWAWLDCSGTIMRDGKMYQIWYVTRLGIGIDRSVIAEYILEPGTDMNHFLIVVRNAVSNYIDGNESWVGQNHTLYRA